MNKIFEIATHVSTPLALAGFFAAAFFFIVRSMFKHNIFPTVTAGAASRILIKIIDRLFWLSLVAMVLGFFGYVIALNRHEPNLPAQKATVPTAPPVKEEQTPFGTSDREVKPPVPKPVAVQPRNLTVDLLDKAILSDGKKIVSLDPGAMAFHHAHSISQDDEVVVIFHGKHWDQFWLFAFTWTTNNNTGVQTPTCNGFVAYLPSNENTHNAEIHAVTNIDRGVRVEILAGKNADIRSTFLWSREDASWKAGANLKDPGSHWPEPTIALQRDNTISLLGDANRNTTLKACP